MPTLSKYFQNQSYYLAGRLHTWACRPHQIQRLTQRWWRRGPRLPRLDSWKISHPEHKTLFLITCRITQNLSNFAHWWLTFSLKMSLEHEPRHFPLFSKTKRNKIELSCDVINIWDVIYFDWFKCYLPAHLCAFSFWPNLCSVFCWQMERVPVNENFEFTFVKFEGFLYGFNLGGLTLSFCNVLLDQLGLGLI